MFKNQGLNSLMTIFLVFSFLLLVTSMATTNNVGDIRQPIENETPPKTCES